MSRWPGSVKGGLDSGGEAVEGAGSGGEERRLDVCSLRLFVSHEEGKNVGNREDALAWVQQICKGQIIIITGNAFGGEMIVACAARAE